MKSNMIIKKKRKNYKKKRIDFIKKKKTDRKISINICNKKWPKKKKGKS